MSRRTPVVLLIDDEPDDVRARVLDLEESATVLLRSPSDVTKSDLRRADVALVDYRIARWPERDDLDSISLKPSNGLALVSVLRSYAEEHLSSKSSRAYAIHSGKLHELSGGLPPATREHAIARTLNLEWVFSKHDVHGSVMVDQVVALARGMAQLPKRWPKASAEASKQVYRLLGLRPKKTWYERARNDVEACHPPAHSWALATNGVAFARWMLHQILPYPCFLWDEHYLAARLHVTVESLREVLAANEKARRAFAPAYYEGMFADFLGDRWWRVGVEQQLWEWTRGDPFGHPALKNALQKRVSNKLEHLDLAQPVVCVNETFRPTDEIVDVLDAVQIQPDEWPTYAEQAWVRAGSLADNVDMRALVVHQDRSRIPE